MNLENNRVVIIDDVYEEVKTLFSVLNKNGISYNYYTGEIKSLPEKPLRGVRLLFLDFVLGTTGQPERTKISKLLKVLEKTLSKDNGPYIILAWTQHNKPSDDLLTPFKNELVKNPTISFPIKIIDMDKSKCINSLVKIERNVKKRFDDNNIFKVLLQWEHLARESSTDVLHTLSELSKPELNQNGSFDKFSSDWNKGIEKHIFNYARVLRGENIVPNKDVLIAAQLAISNIFYDHIENNIKLNTKNLPQLSKRIVKSKPFYNIKERANMNTPFLLETRNLGRNVQPGNIYKYESMWKRINKGKIRLGIKSIIEVFSHDSKALSDKIEELKSSCIPVFMEITPICDYAQLTWKTAKLVLGILWPADFNTRDGKAKLMKRAGYLYPPIALKYDDEYYNFTLHSRYFFTADLKVVNSIRPILKARKELLVDIQHWFASHISRPGKIEFV